MSRLSTSDLQIEHDLASFLTEEALSESDLDPDTFFRILGELHREFEPRRSALLARREEIQDAIDDWHANNNWHENKAGYERFLETIEYTLPEPSPFEIQTDDVDTEISTICGPQLVVPLTNARYALNAANARWGSLYDALYGTDALGPRPSGKEYDPDRGRLVVNWVRDHLDDVAPLSSGSHAEVDEYRVFDGTLRATIGDHDTTLANPSQFKGFEGNPTSPESILLEVNGLHIRLAIDHSHMIGQLDRAGVSDVTIESAITVIMDLEDSVAAVDGSDKAVAYRNWLGLVRGDLETTVEKDGRTFTRRLSPDLHFLDPAGEPFTLPGRAVMLVRQVGLLMDMSAVRSNDGQPISEFLLDALTTVAISRLDLKRTDGHRNSRFGSIYVVVPKLHGPEEAQLVEDIYTRIEQLLDLPRNTIKLGIMDEERRTTLNLAECINRVRSRIVFVNTGFLDRTGDEIHTSMHAGPMLRKQSMKTATWLCAYEDWNVDIALQHGFSGRAQVGKGMWAAPDNMADLLAEKQAHPEAGANCAWVPSPTAATLHATHYHQVSVQQRQSILAKTRRTARSDLLTLPLGDRANWSDDDISDELENNVQGILGYVARWVGQGVGCSKVPNIHNVNLMEDRATCRISSQHIANWLLHDVVKAEQVVSTLRRMALVVDGQNEGDSDYPTMTPGLDGPAFLAASDLIFKGGRSPNGYTEPILHSYRQAFKEERN